MQGQGSWYQLHVHRVVCSPGQLYHWRWTCAIVDHPWCIVLGPLMQAEWLLPCFLCLLPCHLHQNLYLAKARGQTRVNISMDFKRSMNKLRELKGRRAMSTWLFTFIMIMLGVFKHVDETWGSWIQLATTAMLCAPVSTALVNSFSSCSQAVHVCVFWERGVYTFKI